MSYDVIVVGARCAGAATALLLARAGVRVLVLDKGAAGVDTLSTHALMRGGVMQLTRWGLLPAIVAAGTPAVRSTTFSYSAQDVTLAIEPKHGVDALYAPRRVLLDRLLAEAAMASGADVRYGARVDDVILDDQGRVRGVAVAMNGSHQPMTADLVIGADGLYSTIARKVGASTTVQGRHAAAVLYSYWQGLPDTGGYYWKFGPGVSMGSIPTNGDAHCVFASVPPPRFHDEAPGDTHTAYHRWICQAWPEFAERLRTATCVEPIRGFAGHPGFIRRSTGPGWALVGDAGYFKDPCTAHGITDALRDAELLARAVVQDTPAALTAYETMRDDLSRRLIDVTDEIASFTANDDHLQSLHRAFSSEMSREVRALAALEPLPCLSPLANAPHGV